MKIFITILISAVVAVLGAIGVYRYAPLSVLEGDSVARPLGSTITTINGTDRLTDSRTTINDNFAALNATKIENSTTSVAAITTLSNLSSIGTILTGVWNATPITVPYGGTGSTTLSSNQVLLGNGTGIVKVVAGLGTSGQFLTSNGAGTAPSWQSASVNQTIDYNFTSAYFGIKNLFASSTSANPLNLNGVNYNTPSSQGASSTVLVNDGSGNLRWLQPRGYLDWQELADITATSTVAGLAVDIAGREQIQIIFNIPPTGGAPVQPSLQFNSDTSGNYGYTYSISGAAEATGASQSSLLLITDTDAATGFDINIMNIASTRKMIMWQGTRNDNGGSQIPGRVSGGGVWNESTNRITRVQFKTGSGTFPTGTRLTVYGRNN